MALPVIADTLRCAFNWVCAGQHAVNVMHFGGTEADYTALTDALHDFAVGDFSGLTVGEASCTQLTVTPLDGTSGTVDLVLDNLTGAVGAGDFAPAVAGVVSLKTALRGKSYRGRVFMPFVAESIITEGRFGSTAVSNVNAAWADFIVGMAGAGHPLLVASYKLATAQPVTTANLNPAAGTIRRRQSRLRA